MAFWGVEVKPGKPHTHKLPLTTRCRLHISQATLGIGSSSTKSLLQCNVGDKSPILLCSLIPDKTESSSLHLEFEEEEVVIFSVLGPRSIHLSGYYLDKSSHSIDNGDESDSFGEDIGETESEHSPMEDDEYEDDFIDDGDIEVSPPASRYNRGDKLGASLDVVKEIPDDGKPTNGNGNHKRLRKKYYVSDSDSDDPKLGPSIFDLESEDDDHRPTCVKGGASIFDSDDEDDKGPPHSSRDDKNGKSEAKEQSDKVIFTKSKKNRDEDAVYQISGGNSKTEEIPDSETERTIEQRNDSTFPLEVSHGKDEKPKKKRKRQSKPHTDGVVDEPHIQEAKTDVATLKDDKGLEHPDESEIRHETDAKVKKTKKKRAKEGQTDVKEDKSQNKEAKTDDITHEELIGDESNDKLKKKKKKRVKEDKEDDITQDQEEPNGDEFIVQLSQPKGLEHSEDNAEKLKKKKKKQAKTGQPGGAEDDTMVDAPRKDDISETELTKESVEVGTNRKRNKSDKNAKRKKEAKEVNVTADEDNITDEKKKTKRKTPKE